jgi:DNA-binding winged helix-turn-helix (wHTH) protein
VTERIHYEFDGFLLDPTKRLLLYNGEPTPLRPTAFNLLLKLVEQHGKTVSKSQLMESVWGPGSGDDRRLHVTLHEVRRKFGDSAKESRFIARDSNGYRFVANVREMPAPNDSALDVDGSLNRPDENSELQDFHSIIGEQIEDPSQMGTARDYDSRFTTFKKALRGRALPVISLSIVAVASIVILLYIRRRPLLIPQISSLAATSSVHPKQEFTVQIEGLGFNPDTVHVVLVGPGCKRFGPCTVPNDVLLDYGQVLKNKIERVPLTLDTGEFKLYVQNGKDGPPSNPWTVRVPYE